MRLSGVDLLRGLAAFGIVGCHLSLSPRTLGGEWVTVLCDFNVGVFAAIAGFLMTKTELDGQEQSAPSRVLSLRIYVIRRMGRLLPTFFFWSACFILATSAFDLVLDGGHLNSKYGMVDFWLRVVFLGGASTHLWFLPCLFYAQVLLRALAVLPVNGVVLVLLGGTLVVPSALMGSWFGTYPLRLFAFLVTGYGLGRIKRKIPLGVLSWLSAVGLVAYVALNGVVPAFVRGWFATVPLLLFFTSIRFEGRVSIVVSTLGATSMGVYLIHPLATRGLSVLWPHVFPSPFGAIPVLSEWMLAWASALVAAYILLRVPFVNRFIR